MVEWFITENTVCIGATGTETTSCVETGPAAVYIPFAEAARLTVIVVVPAPTIVTSPDEFTVATLGALLE